MALQDWKPRKTTKRIPYGYRLSNDPQVMEPDPEIIVFLDDALNSLDAGISLREACDTINARNPGMSLSHMGLRKIWNRERPNHAVKIVQPKPTKERMTREARSKYRKRMKLSSEKKSLAAIQKRIAKQTEELSGIKKAEEAKIEELTAPVVIRTEIEDVEVPREQIRPHPGPQTEFLSAPEQEVLYGGAAGGGKSFAMLLDPLRHVDNPQFFGVVLRRTTDELRKLVNESQFLYKKLYGKKIRWLEQKSKWVFPSGAELWMTYSDNERDLDRFQGQEYSWVGIDELTHYPTPETWNYLRTRLRSTVETGLPTYMRATTNPGGPGHYWVKKMFIDPAPPNTPFVARNEEDEEMFIPQGDPGFPAEMWGRPMFYRRFIPAKLSDNPSLGWQYRANLMMQKEDTRRKLLDGDWSVAEGAAFPEFRLDTHTCRPFEIPKNWLRFKSADYGYSQRQYSAVYWYAVDPNWGTLYVYRELYINQLTGSQLQNRINEIEREANDHTSYSVLDSSTWAVRGQTGPTIAEEMNRAGGRWRPSDRSQGSRIASKNRLHELLRVDPQTGKPGIIFFDTCRRIIADLPSIPSAPPEQRDQDDIDQKYPNDHSYDSIRYGIQSRPRGESGWDAWGSNTTQINRPADRVFGY